MAIENQIRFESTIQTIDEINLQDPNKELYEGKSVAKEWLYSQRMTEMTFQYAEDPTEAMQLAARGQHIKRWSIPRNDYPMDRKGYLKWRTDLKLMHAKLMREILEEHEYESDTVDWITMMVKKNKLKTDPSTQALEDIICMVFLKYYFSEFAKTKSEEKIIAILQKTWAKMTSKGQEMALKLPFEEEEAHLIKKALDLSSTKYFYL